MCRLIEPAYAKGISPTGRPGYDCIVLFLMELLRVWYGLSDGDIEEQVNDSLLNTTPVLNSNSIAILFHPYYKCDGKNVAMPSKSEIGTNQRLNWNSTGNRTSE